MIHFKKWNIIDATRSAHISGHMLSFYAMSTNTTMLFSVDANKAGIWFPMSLVVIHDIYDVNCDSKCKDCELCQHNLWVIS